MADLVQKFMKTAISVSGSSTRTLPALPSPATADTSNRSPGGLNQNPKQLVVCRQWWKVCWVYGDQYKQGQKLYQAQKRILAKSSRPMSAGTPADSCASTLPQGQLPQGQVSTSPLRSHAMIAMPSNSSNGDSAVNRGGAGPPASTVVPNNETDSGNDSASTTQITPTKGARRPCGLVREQIPE